MTKEDFGPFADMDPALKRAITSYGTPPVRQIVSVRIRDVGSYSYDELPTDIDGWIEWLNAARKEAPAEYRDSLNCVLRYERGRYDEGDSSDFTIWYARPETDEEMVQRVSRGIAYVQNHEARQRAEFERLKAKFG